MENDIAFSPCSARTRACKDIHFTLFSAYAQAQDIVIEKENQMGWTKSDGDILYALISKDRGNWTLYLRRRDEGYHACNCQISGYSAEQVLKGMPEDTPVVRYDLEPKGHIFKFVPYVNEEYTFPGKWDKPEDIKKTADVLRWYELDGIPVMKYKDCEFFAKVEGKGEQA